MNPPTCADIIKLTKLGMLDREIAEKFNMDRKQIGRIRRLHNIKPGYEHRKNQVQAMRSTDHDNIITLMKKQTAQEAMWVDKLNGRVFESLKMKPMQEKKMPRNMEHIPTRSVLDTADEPPRASSAKNHRPIPVLRPAKRLLVHSYQSCAGEDKGRCRALESAWDAGWCARYRPSLSRDIHRH